MTTDKITIGKDKYLSLLKDSHELASLEAVGVDNLDGFGQEMFEEFLEKQIMDS